MQHNTSNQYSDRATGPYTGYFKSAVPETDDELARVGPGSACGEYLRRYWLPVALSSELRDLPVPIRILGEDLVLFRTGAGKIGLLNRHCSHRGTSLEYARVTDRGIQCCYHGWHYGVDGTIIETPGEPASSRIGALVCHGAYPVKESKELIFAYMGPPDESPQFPTYDTFELPDTDSAPISFHFPCNWLQVHENCMDPFHATWLHARHSSVQLTPAWGAMPVMDWRPTPLGMLAASARRIGDNIWITVVDAIMPCLRQTGFWEDGVVPKGFARSALSVWIVPMDDTNSLMIGQRFFNQLVDPNGLGNKALCGKEMADLPGQSGSRPYEEKQRDPNDWEANTSQRPIAVHRLEHFGTTDKGVAMLRRILRRSIRNMAGGERIAAPDAKRDGSIPTYVQDTVLHIPPRQDLDDTELLTQVRDRVVEISLNPDWLLLPDRDTIIRLKLAEIEHDYCGR